MAKITQDMAQELLSVTLGYKEYIDALPSEVVAKLPAMPGIDGDWADATIDCVQKKLKENQQE
jgi:hypothetical protein